MSVVIPVVSLGTKYVLDAVALDRVRETLRAGGLVVHPTDTVYGLAADPFQDAAVGRVYAAKARPRNLALSMAVPEVSDVFRYGTKTPLAENFCAKNLPGPYTVVLKATPEAPKALVSQAGLIGLRVPDHPIPRLLAKACGPIISTSANRHGQPSPTTCEDAQAQLGEAVDVYLDAGPTPLGQESTVVDLSGPRAKILRRGAVPKGA
ncbi:MAG: L-threonylcarbamoyladenylate synthase [Candidatus Thermoplasmatota archaeon]